MNATTILSKLVSFPVLGGESNLTIIHWIKEYIESHGISTTLVPNEENTKASLHCRIGPAVDGGTILSGHTDVVPVKGQTWDTDPFTLTEKNGKLFARGSCDMKGFVACCLAVLPAMIKADLKTPIYFAFSYDEEIGCLAAPDLIAHIKTTYEETPKYAIIGEPSLLEPVIGKKGVCYVKTEVNGSAGHSSGIHKEISAIHESTRLIVWLENKMKTIATVSSDDRFDPPHSTVHVGQINGGVATNIVADYCCFEWDIRVIPKDDIHQLFEDYYAFCAERETAIRKKYTGFKITNTLVHPPVPALDTKETDSIVGLVQKLTGNHSWKTVAYAAEAGQFHEAGYESIICGPGSIEQAHRANEFVTQEQLDSCVEILEKLVKELS
ncbi:acetylornithine deacetylase [Kordia sp. YSTF-M3]|uniref:Acetylornithine deacetylase n=1 Tax=Kordia aestuariivivens TaxID=2759037 RepID=A0ABR7QCT3_9FLAO|nr:acetylornithine deacetylase [Kordia aestuariivivens]MBC8756369.1 acetylornithine deacetylase [Kordia aestuariivivens]